MTDSKNPPILEVVKDASKPPKAGSRGKGSSKSTKTSSRGKDSGNKSETGDIDRGFEIDKGKIFSGYTIINGAFNQLGKHHPGGKYDAWPLCDFVCRIVLEVIAEDGLNDTNFLRIEGRRADGLLLPTVDVPAKAFYGSQGSWPNEAWGTRVLVLPGSAKVANLRTAVIQYSRTYGDIQQHIVHKYVGWKKIEREWHYLTGSGAIAAAGLIDTVETDLGPGNMNRYQLPTPLAGDELKQAADAALLLLQVTPSRPQIGAALLAAVARAPLGECQLTDFAIWLHGLTGSRKSALAAVVLAFYGDFSARSFPANWSDTVNDLEAKSYQAKDSIYVIDDFKPSVNRVESEKQHAAAERIVRGTGNGAGRGRRNANMQASAAPFNRSMLIVTAEDLPRGQSLLGRLLVLELGRDDVDNQILTKLQHAVQAGLFSGLMAAYLQWLALRMDEHKRDFPKIVEQLRNSTNQSGFASSHTRAPEIYSNLVAAAELFLDFLESSSCLSREQNSDTLLKIETDLKAAFAEQGAYVQEQCEIERFLQLLRAAFSSGNAHISTVIKQGPPVSHPYAWGWRSAGHDLNSDDQYKPMGDCCGWYAEPRDGQPAEVWLEPNTAFKIVQDFARHQGDSFLMSSGSLWRRMVDRGMLLKTELVKDGKAKPTVKRVVAGVTKRVLVLAAEVVESST